jgi:hypothetical protein
MVPYTTTVCCVQPAQPVKGLRVLDRVLSDDDHRKQTLVGPGLQGCTSSKPSLACPIAAHTSVVRITMNHLGCLLVRQLNTQLGVRFGGLPCPCHLHILLVVQSVKQGPPGPAAWDLPIRPLLSCWRCLHACAILLSLRTNSQPASLHGTGAKGRVAAWAP